MDLGSCAARDDAEALRFDAAGVEDPDDDDAFEGGPDGRCFGDTWMMVRLRSGGEGKMGVVVGVMSDVDAGGSMSSFSATEWCLYVFAVLCWLCLWLLVL